MSASARLAAASAVAASLFAFAPVASAADLYEDSYGQAPRYERYAQPPADFEPPYPPRFTDGGSCVPREVVRDRLLSEVLVKGPYPTSVEAFLIHRVPADDLVRRMSRSELAKRAEERTRLQEAVEFLRDLLADGPLPTGVCYLRGQIEGIARRTLQRALEPAGVRKRQPNGASDQVWELDPSEDAGK